MKTLKIIFFSFFVLLLLLGLGAKKGWAAEAVDKTTEWEDAVYGGEIINLEQHGNEIFSNFITSGSDAILGPISPDYQESHGGGMVQGMGNLIAGMYANPPASSTEYFADLGSRLKIVKPAYAQGLGFEGLRSILPLWKRFRDISYLFFVVVFVITGFAIMFRTKLNPQTVISVQNSLPKIVVSLILVTFSYAIAGLLIDLLYVLTSLMISVVGEPIDYNLNVFRAAGGFIGVGGFGNITSTAASQISEFVQDIFSGLGGAILGVSTSLLARLVFAIAIAVALFRLFLSLLMSYITIILGVIFSPFLLMLSALPGQRGLGTWLKLMLANILPFPLVAAIFSLATSLSKAAQASTEGTWVPPFIGSGTSSYVPVLIGIGMIILAPQLVDMVKKLVGAPSLGEGIGGALLGAAKAPYAGISGVYGRLTRKHQLTEESMKKLIDELQGRATSTPESH